MVQRKAFTPEQIEAINFRITVINLELTAYDYMLYQKIQDLMIPVKQELERLHIYKHMYKKVYNDAMIEINSLCTACRISEALDFMGTFVSPFDRYRSDYMKEGGLFFSTVCYKFSNLIKDDMFKLHYSTRMAIINSPGVKAEYADLATMLYKVLLFCKMADEIARFEAERIGDIGGFRTNPKQAQSVRYHKFSGLVDRLYHMVGPDVKFCPENIGDRMVLAGQIILNKLTEHGTSDITASGIVDTVYDYAFYCVARMLMDVRKTGAMNPEDIELLKANMHFSDDSIREMEKELKRTRIDISSGDPMEIKEYVPLMKKAFIIQNIFIKVLATSLKVELIDKNPFVCYHRK